MGTKSNPGQFDCYRKADGDEPMFVLLGRDPHAGTLIRLWSLLRHQADLDPAKVQDALMCADDMDEWCKSMGKSPEEPPAVFEALTEGDEDHPPGYKGTCFCNVCSYGPDT